MTRKLSDSHLKLYAKGEKLGKLFDVIQCDPELAFEIRRDDTAMVYYRKKKLLSIKGGKVTELLDSSYLGNEELKIDLTDENNLNKVKAIRDYFRQAKVLAYKYSFGAEMELQQNIMLGNSSFDGRYVVADVEWAFSQSDITKEERIPGTRIDLVIVDTHKNEEGKNDIYLAEVKLGADAIEGPSGIKGHVEKTNALIETPHACEALVEDVKSLIAQKMELGIISGTPGELVFADKPKLMLILAYRSRIEKQGFEQKMEDIIAELPPHYMEKTKVVYYDMLSRLEDK